MDEHGFPETLEEAMTPNEDEHGPFLILATKSKGLVVVSEDNYVKNLTEWGYRLGGQYDSRAEAYVCILEIENSIFRHVLS